MVLFSGFGRVSLDAVRFVVSFFLDTIFCEGNVSIVVLSIRALLVDCSSGLSWFFTESLILRKSSSLAKSEGE